MSPLFMDTGYELNSPGSVSAEGSNTAGSEREEGGQQMRGRGRVRQEKNRNAARKSRRKQTERADELHEELQCLERSNSEIKKEIAALKNDLQLYTTALEHHEPFCCLKDSASSSTTRPSVSSSLGCRTNSSPPGVPPQASRSAFAAAPSLSASLTSGLGLQTRDCVESARLSSLTPTPPTTTTLDLPHGLSAELFTSSSSATAPDSLSFSAVPTPHSLFSGDPSSLITPRPTNVPPVCTSLVSRSAPSRSGGVHESSSTSANAHFSPLRPAALDEFLMTQATFLPASSDVVTLNSPLASENVGLGCPMNVSQLRPGQFSRNSVNSSLPCSFLQTTLLDPSPQSLSMSPPASAFAFKPSYSQQVTLNCAPLLSMLTVPSPLVSQTTSSRFDEPVPQPPPSLLLFGDTSRDLSLSELLEGNDWILSGTSHQ
ncbi:basic leucine zipper transcriptional factor ATF-like 2 [Cebidichthys violaceus]|uniref:basic leucine zipper transcriptional factor ATF-like 2 n=1 Tax=Cebidichthys violaceus TaxID=271503 RepID=UPI0035CA9596